MKQFKWTTAHKTGPVPESNDVEEPQTSSYGPQLQCIVAIKHKHLIRRNHKFSEQRELEMSTLVTLLFLEDKPTAV
jgi:hypothetical protein